MIVYISATLTARMIATSLNRCGAQNSIKTIAIWLFVDPLPNSIEHVSMNFKVLITKSGMMEYTHYVIHNLVDRYSGIFPSIENATTTGLAEFNIGHEYRLRCDILQDSGCDSASNRVQLICEVVLRQHGMSRICAVWVIPWLKLRIRTVKILENTQMSNGWY